MYIYDPHWKPLHPLLMVWQRAWLKANARTSNKTANTIFHVPCDLLYINEHTVRHCVVPAAGSIFKQTRKKEKESKQRRKIIRRDERDGFCCYTTKES
jgi:hypothetical protein